MKIALWVLGALGGVVLLVCLIGWMLPVSHVASASATLSRPPDAVYTMVSEVASYPKWWSEMSRVETLPPVDGRQRFRQHMGSDAVVIEVLEAAAPTRFVTRIADPDQPFGGTWTLEIAPSGAGSTLTVTERGEVYNPLFRFVSRFVMGHTATIDSFLQALLKATS
jgi:uncharacterized protein YndB with AHSA1/START domain